MKLFEQRKPPLVAMISSKNTEDCIIEIINSIYDGADAIGIQLDHIKSEYKTREELEKIIVACNGLPVYITSYKGGENSEYTYEECAELLLLAGELGAELLDVPGDFYRKEQNGMTFDSEAVAKQRALIDLIHSRGQYVLMSCHHADELSQDEIISHARAQVERGADVVKIVAKCTSERKLHEHLDTIRILKDELGVPFLYLTSGPRKFAGLIRQIGPNFGVCMYLCVANHGKGSTPLQPKLRNIKLVRDNIVF